MSDEISTTDAELPLRDTVLEDFRPLGTSPAGESFVVVRRPSEEDFLDEESEQELLQLVLKKVTRARLRSPQRFRQKFEALCRLDHRGLCSYRDLYIGEAATRITRDFVDGLPLNEFLLQPITDQEKAHLAELTEESEFDDDAEDNDAGEDEADNGDRADGDDRADDGDSGPDDDNRAGAGEDGEDQGIDAAPRTADLVAAASPADHSLPADTDQDVTGHGLAETSSVIEEALDESEDEPTAAPPGHHDTPPDTGPITVDRPSTLEIPESLLEDSEAADRALDLIILRLRRIIPQLVAALEYLHRFRHVHGHLTPSNILITADEEVRLTDYGLHPELDIVETSRQGYANYHAPEVEEGEFSPQSDLYSLGAILFEALAGCPYGTGRQQDPSGNGDGRAAPLYLSEIAPHCPATWVDLIHGLLATDPDDRPPLDEVTQQLASTETRSVNIPASVVQQEESTLHGRNESLEFLADLAQHCSRNHTMGLAVVEGDTGVGKTAVLDALARRASQRGWVVLHGRCYHREPIAYQGWEEIVDRLAQLAASLPDKPQRRMEADRLRAARLFPQLLFESEELPDIGRRAAVDGFRRFLAQLSEQRPLLICFDDIHWAGRDSARLLADLAEHPAGTRLMVVSTWHPDANGDQNEHPFWTELATAPVNVERVPILGFSHDEARDYVIEHADHFTLRQKQEVLRRGGLNPLLIDELIHELDQEAADGNDQDRSDEDRPAGEDSSDHGQDHDQPLPEGDDAVDHHLRSFIEQRLADLERAERLVLQLLAIASGPLASDLLTRAISRELGAQRADNVSGQQVADSLVEKRLARRARRLDGADEEQSRYVVIHNLCRRVILDEVGQDHHARLCGLVADALSSGATRADDLRFEYLQRAGRHEETHRAAILAARAAARRFAFHRASHLWQWLLERQALEEEDRPHYAQSLLGSGHFKQALEQLDQLLPDDDPARDLELRLSRVQAQLGAGCRHEAIAAMDDAAAAAGWSYRCPSAGDRITFPPRKMLATFQRWKDVTNCDSSSSLDAYDRAATDLLDLGLQAAPFLDCQARRRLEVQFAHRASSLGHGPLLAQDRLHMIGAPWLPFLIRHSAKIERWLDQALILARRCAVPSIQARALETSALLARHRGRIDEAVDTCLEAIDLLESGQLSKPLVHARLLFLLTELRLCRGELTAADDLIARFKHRVRHRRWLTVLAALCACDRDLLIGDLQSAEENLDDIEDFLGEHKDCLLHLWFMSRRTSLDIALGRPEVSIAHWDLLLDRVYGRGVRNHPAARLLIHRSLARALAALIERQRVLDESRQRQSLRRFRRTLRHLGDLEPWMGLVERAELLRLRARYAILVQRPPKALTQFEEADELSGNDPPRLLDALNTEARARVLDALERPEARATSEKAQQLQDEIGLYLPLVLEGWPVPEARSKLKEDP